MGANLTVRVTLHNMTAHTTVLLC